MGQLHRRQFRGTEDEQGGAVRLVVVGQQPNTSIYAATPRVVVDAARAQRCQRAACSDGLLLLVALPAALGRRCRDSRSAVLANGWDKGE